MLHALLATAETAARWTAASLKILTEVMSADLDRYPTGVS